MGTSVSILNCKNQATQEDPELQIVQEDENIKLPKLEDQEENQIPLKLEEENIICLRQRTRISNFNSQTNIRISLLIQSSFSNIPSGSKALSEENKRQYLEQIRAIKFHSQFKENPNFKKMFRNCVTIDFVQLDDGSIYFGQCSHGIKNGFGTNIYQNGSVYEGYWLNNQRHFEGRFINTEGVIYEGQMWAEEQQGNGIYRYPDQVKCETHYDFEEALKNFQTNFSPIISQEEKQYYGDLLDGKKNGYGAIVWKDKSFYVGKFVDDRRHGFGFFKTSDGKSYNGQWFKDQMNGLGTYIWPNGKVYIGTYTNDQKDEYGIFMWPDGSQYIGRFSNGKMEGIGRVIDKNGKIIDAIWKEGKRIKNSVITSLQDTNQSDIIKESLIFGIRGINSE